MNLIIKNLKKAIRDSKKLNRNLISRNLPTEIALIESVIASQLIVLDFAQHDNDMEEILSAITLHLDQTQREIRNIGKDLVYIGNILESSNLNSEDQNENT